MRPPLTNQPFRPEGFFPVKFVPPTVTTDISSVGFSREIAMLIGDAPLPNCYDKYNFFVDKTMLPNKSLIAMMESTKVVPPRGIGLEAFFVGDPLIPVIETYPYAMLKAMPTQGLASVAATTNLLPLPAAMKHPWTNLSTLGLRMQLMGWSFNDFREVVKAWEDDGLRTVAWYVLMSDMVNKAGALNLSYTEFLLNAAPVGEDERLSKRYSNQLLSFMEKEFL